MKDFDFADEENVSLLSESILDENPNLYVVKSISKSYGVPGLRLGVLASGNADVIRRLKRSVSIWNINSMAEFFMQILDKYKADYENSLREIKTERKRLFEALRQIKLLKVYPSQANYFMCELLTGKIKNGRQYIRIAIRTGTENQRLVELLKEETQ